MGRFKGMFGFGGIETLRALGRFFKAIATQDTDAFTQAMINWLDKGVVPEGLIRKTILDKFEGTVKKAKKEGCRSGTPATIGKVMELLDSQPKFMELCQRLDLTREMFEEEATKLLKE